MQKEARKARQGRQAKKNTLMRFGLNILLFIETRTQIAAGVNSMQNLIRPRSPLG